MLIFGVLFMCAMMTPYIILKIVLAIYPVWGIVSSIRHRNDKLVLSDKGIETDFKPTLKNGRRRTLITWEEISYIEIYPGSNAMLSVHNKIDIYDKNISLMFPLGGWRKLRKAISEIGHVSCQLKRWSY